MDFKSSIRLASRLNRGDHKRREILKKIAEERFAAQGKVAFSPETAAFVDWVVTNKEPMSESAASSWVSKFLGGKEPKPYEKKEKPRKTLAVGDMVQFKPDKAPPENLDLFEEDGALLNRIKYKPGTIEAIDSDHTTVKIEGNTIKFFGTKTGVSTGLYRFTPKSNYEGSKKLVEVVYFSKPGEAEPYRKHVVQEYIDRAPDQKRKRPYYSGPILGFAISKEGNTYFTVQAQQRPYPVSITPKKGKLLYLGQLKKRPNWKGDFDKQIEELAE